SPARRIEGDDAVETARIQQHHTRAKLLPTHGVAAAGNADRQSIAAGVKDGSPKLRKGSWADNAGHASPVHLRVDIVHFGLRVSGLAACRGQGQCAIADKISSGWFHSLSIHPPEN